MKCPFCSHTETKVVDKRETEEDNVTRRRRECLKCEKRFTTYERVEMSNITIVKKSEKREPFNRDKLKRGLFKACEKRPVNAEQIEIVVNEIEAELRGKDTTEIPSSVIGELVMKKLKKLDKVAYIRFASVYREFTDLESFEKELKNLLKKG
ncbi:transcriptional repressor NrdR [Candidatus Woesearchaeota archaeon]|nr:transcriptional repressor NrdR [Candidatus Woesearchaeota archaeon]